VLDLFKELGTKEYTLTDRDRDRLKITKAEAISHRIMRLKIPLVFPRMRVAGAKLRR
jgi:DNA-directed RNA polymerase I subunit RPA49